MRAGRGDFVWATGRAALAARAQARAAEVQAAGATSLRGIAAARGLGTWSAVQVARVLDRRSVLAPGRGCGAGARPPTPAGTTRRGGGKVAYYAPTNLEFLENRGWHLRPKTPR